MGDGRTSKDTNHLTKPTKGNLTPFQQLFKCAGRKKRPTLYECF